MGVKTASLTPVNLIYEQAGHGSPLLLLHGLGSSRTDWPLQLPVLLPRYRVIVADLRGHGQSPKPRGPYTLPVLAADVAALLRRLTAAPTHVAGLSLGGAVAQQLALDAPELVRSLILVNTAARFVADRWQQRLVGVRRLAAVYTRPMAEVAQGVAAGLFPRPEQQAMRRETAARLAANDLAAYRATLWALARFDVRARLHEITCPTLIVAGEEDATVPLAAKRLLAAQIPHSRLVVVPHSGHATPFDQPAQFNELMLGFLEEVERHE
ncbi:MAG: alpha/beta hydrolase [Anaerolineae bacterium]